MYLYPSVTADDMSELVCAIYKLRTRDFKAEAMTERERTPCTVSAWEIQCCVVGDSLGKLIPMERFYTAQRYGFIVLEHDMDSVWRVTERGLDLLGRQKQKMAIAS